MLSLFHYLNVIALYNDNGGVAGPVVETAQPTKLLAGIDTSVVIDAELPPATVNISAVLLRVVGEFSTRKVRVTETFKRNHSGNVFKENKKRLSQKPLSVLDVMLSGSETPWYQQTRFLLPVEMTTGMYF